MLATACLLATLSAPVQATGEQAFLVLDASGSMWQQVDGRSKVEIARDAVDAMLADWNPEVSLGLIAYGHNRRGDCGDIEVLRPAEGFDREGISRMVHGLNAVGMTPITASVRLAAEQLRYTEHKATVILVSDGEETCKADPCALGHELAAQGIDFTAHVIGFDLPEGEARTQLQCLASSTGGQYIEARDAGELSGALRAVAQTAEAAPEDDVDDRSETQWYMPCVDLYESDYDRFEMQPGQHARDCQARCAAEAQCDAYTYTVPGYQAEHGMCWLKSGEPWQKVCHDCISGAKPGVKVFVDEDFVDPVGSPGCEVDSPTTAIDAEPRVAVLNNGVSQ
ncbi:MAG: PAN domain-containing protein [Rhodocyclaceae bacterium]